MIQVIASGATPLESRCDTASSPGLPAPMLHAARRQEHVGHHALEVRTQFFAVREFQKSGVQTLRLDAPLTERQRTYAVEARGRVQAHELVRIHPMAAGAIAFIDYRYGRVALGEQRVDERQAARARADNEIVRFNCRVHYASEAEAYGTGAVCGASGLDCASVGSATPHYWSVMPSRDRSSRTTCADRRERR